MKRKAKLFLWFVGLILTTMLLISVPKIRAQETASPLDTLKEHISDEEPNLWQWIYGKYDKDSQEKLREVGVIPAIEGALLGQLVGVPNERGVSQGGTLNTLAAMIGGIYGNPPASGIYYASTVFQNLGVIPVYAANGVGFSALSPILNIWKVFRNLAYALLTIVFLVLGLMIMFRVKISPQAVLTIENALPRVIGVLILITFSYAIAGFLIDLMYVTIGILIAVAKQGGMKSIGDIVQTQQQYARAGMGRVATMIFPTIFRSFDDFIKMFYGGYGFAIPAVLVGGVIGTLIGGLGVGTVGGAIAGPGALATLLILIICIVAIFLLFKLWFALIKVYLSIILQIIFSPLLLLGGVLPNSPFSFGSWLKGLVANLLVFPTLVILLIIAYTLSRENVTSLWTPPFLGGTALSHGTTGVIAIGFLLILPSVPDIIKGAMGIKESGIGAMIGQAFAPIRSGVGTAGRMAIFVGGGPMLDRAGTFVAEKIPASPAFRTRARSAVRYLREFLEANRIIGQRGENPRIKG